MWVRDARAGQGRRTAARQTGVASVEFAIVAGVFCLFMFGVMELSRAIYVINTLPEVTRRAAVAAANVQPNEAALAPVRAQAVFRDAAGTLLLGDPVTDQHVRIDYLALLRGADGSLTPTVIPSASLPATPARNRVNCTIDANAINCIKLVRARICAPTGDGDCPPVTYQTLFSMIELPIQLPASATIVPAQSLGYTAPACIPCGE
jgi:Flp pilus assembly protein TadG